MDARELSQLVSATLPRAWRGHSSVHGELHWRCVAATGLALAGGLPSVDRVVVLCFGLLHDTRRENESVDPEHGPRASGFASELLTEGALPLDPARFGLLREALVLHSDGLVSSDPTVGACWDADRLHLPRVGIEPDPALLSTRAAHGAAPLAEATTLREIETPSWDALVALACSGRRE